jgi:anti-sigma-K factor RskA
MSNHDYADIHALSGAYAVHAINDIERVEFTRHLASCAQCRDEVETFQATALKLSVLFSTTPPHWLRDQVLHDISAVRPLPPQVSDDADQHIEAARRERAPQEGAAPRRARHRLQGQHQRNPWLAAVAAALVILGGGAAVAWHPWERSSQSQLTAADQVIQAPDAQRFVQTLDNGGTATVIRSKSVGQAVLQTNQLPPAPSGKVYQAWLQAPDNKFVSAGLLPSGPNPTVVLNGNTTTAIGVGLSVEPAGGSPQPTTTPIALFRFA